MAGPKETLGYPSRTAAVLALRGKGKTTRQIATTIGIDIKTVAALECSAARTRKTRPAEQLGRTVLFPLDVLESLAPHAAKRCMHPNRLARLIVETVVDEAMIDAVLDDADDMKGWV